MACCSTQRLAAARFMEDLLLVVKSPVSTALDHRFVPIGNSFLNVVDTEEDLGPVARTRSRSCPVSYKQQLPAVHIPATTEEDVTEEEDEAVVTSCKSEPRATARRTQRQSGGLKHLSCRPAGLLIVKNGLNKSKLGRLNVDRKDSGGGGTATTAADPWQESFESCGILDEAASPLSNWRTAFDSMDEHTVMSPTSPVSPSWADAWQEEQGEHYEMAEEIPLSPTWPITREAILSKRKDKVTSEDDLRDNTTTIMIQNLPEVLTQRALAKGLDTNGFAGQYDFMYLPTDFGSGTSHGYAFVNFCVPGASQRLIDLWDRQRPWGRTTMSKALRIMPAAVQGLEANVARWNSAKMRRVRNPDHRPMVMPGGQQPKTDGGEQLLDETWESHAEGGSPTSPTSPTSPSCGRRRTGRQTRRRW